ncbi:cytochrome c-type biogenesis protein [Bauldia sp.]|uniref:cytochrome c-type biogenesis protein n=1 Tax=Bauldia sp. TaxID=2575872 RepID=UPI003BABE487
MAGRIVALLAALLMVATPAAAVLPDEVLDDPALEDRARSLSTELRCMVCQNQSIDDSDAPLARDLRILLRERLVAGDSDTEVMDFLVARYGEFILLKPRVTSLTALLWAAPVVLLVVGGFITYRVMARRKPASATTGRLSQDEEAALKRILSKDD